MGNLLTGLLDRFPVTPPPEQQPATSIPFTLPEVQHTLTGKERVPQCYKQCFPCEHWQKIPGGCWWIGTCAVTGDRRGFRNACTVK